jgi:hypothetical protein
MFFLAISGASLASEILSAAFFADDPNGLLGFLVILISFLPPKQRSSSLSPLAE